MIPCPACGAKLRVSTFRKPLSSVPDPEDDSVTFTLCWSAKVALKCPSCGSTVTGGQIEDSLPQKIIITEGARELSKLNGKRLTSESGAAAARKRWNDHHKREALAAGVTVAEFVRLKKRRKKK